MPNNDDAIAYTQLAGRNSRGGFLGSYFFGNQLFMGPGHLVSINCSGLPLYEKYNRFYFSDIASIVFGPSNRQGIYYGVVAILWLIFVMGFALFGDRIIFLIGGGLVTVMGLAVCIFNYGKGERCRFFIRTAVQVVEIPSVSTMAKAYEVMSILSPLIQEAQQRNEAAQTPVSPMEPLTGGVPGAPLPPEDNTQW